MTRDEWEAICKRCGRCCYEKVDFQGKIYYTQVPCEHLDLNTRLCRTYPERETSRSGCVALTPELLKQGVLPADCPYVAGLKNYPAPFMDDETGPHGTD
jgi:uncharacterized cysteine cluster protein YcgN (CxxCxxCC family)